MVSMVPAAATPEVVELDVTFRAVDTGTRVEERLPSLFAAAWPAYRRWYLSQGEAARPSFAECSLELRRYMPELAGAYDRLVDAVGGGDLEARFLSHWCPPPLFTACSLAALTGGENVLIRNYDYPPLLCDNTALLSSWHGTRVLAMGDCVWGAVDGVNAHGLAVAIAFGGRPAVGRGFGIGLVVRYLLEFARDVPEALDVLRRVPVQLAYNVALVDRSGRAEIARVAPDRPLTRARGLTAGNRQGRTEWPEHAAFCGTVAREAALADAVATPGMTAASLLSRFLEPPVYRDPSTTTWGTVYTAAYDANLGTLELAWPNDTWRLSMHHFVEGGLSRRTSVAQPPPAFVEPEFVSGSRAAMIA
jgi:predicted choloylglycine hydrolase